MRHAAARRSAPRGARCAARTRVSRLSHPPDARGGVAQRRVAISAPCPLPWVAGVVPCCTSDLLLTSSRPPPSKRVRALPAPLGVIRALLKGYPFARLRLPGGVHDGLQDDAVHGVLHRCGEGYGHPGKRHPHPPLPPYRCSVGGGGGGVAARSRSSSPRLGAYRAARISSARGFSCFFFPRRLPRRTRSLAGWSGVFSSARSSVSGSHR